MMRLIFNQNMNLRKISESPAKKLFKSDFRIRSYEPSNTKVSKYSLVCVYDVVC